MRGLPLVLTWKTKKSQTHTSSRERVERRLLAIDTRIRVPARSMMQRKTRIPEYGDGTEGASFDYREVLGTQVAESAIIQIIICKLHFRSAQLESEVWLQPVRDQHAHSLEILKKHLHMSHTGIQPRAEQEDIILWQCMSSS